MKIAVYPTRQRRFYPKEIRQQAVAMHEEGLGAKRIGKALGIDASVIKEWLRRYRRYGEASLQPWWRENMRSKREEAVSPPRNIRVDPHETFREALQLYMDSDLKRSEVCRRCGVNYNLFSYYLRRYHPRVLAAARRKRSLYHKEQMKQSKRRYRKAIRLYASTDLSCREICERTGVSASGFRSYIHRHHRDIVQERGRLLAERRTIRPQGGEKPMSHVLLENGKNVLLRSTDKYSEAIRIYRTTPESLKSIATRFGLVYNTVGQFIRRNLPEAIRQHKALVAKSRS